MTRKCISTKKLWIIGVAVLVLVVGATVGVTLSVNPLNMLNING